MNHEINYKKRNGTAKYSPEKNSDPRITHQNKFRTHEYSRENFETTKKPREKISDPENTHEKKSWTHKGMLKPPE